MIRHKTHQLRNGTRVILVPHKDTTSVTLLVLYGVGSRYEPTRLSGASHFIEHMMFKGTSRRKDTSAISRDLDSVGADFNAFTGKEYTGYYIRLQSEKFTLASDMLEDMLYHSVLRAGDVESERRVILEEIRMYEDNPATHVEEMMEEELLRGSSLGRRICGTDKSMNGMTRSDLARFRDAYYIPSRTVIAVAGKYDEDAVLQELDRLYGRKRSAAAPKPFRRFSVGSGRYTAPRVALEYRDMGQAQVAMGFPAYSYDDRRMPALKVMSTILGETMSSRLFIKVRVKKGFCYFIRSSISPYQDIGCFEVRAGLARDGVHKALRLVAKELGRMKSGGASGSEIARAKENMKGRLMLAMEDSSRVADWYARQELLTGRILTPEEKIREVMKVSAGDVMRVAKDVLRPEKLTLAVVGPYEDKTDFERDIKGL